MWEVEWMSLHPPPIYSGLKGWEIKAFEGEFWYFKFKYFIPLKISSKIDVEF